MSRTDSASEKTKAFIAKARAIHGRKYDYSRVKYVNIDTKVEVVCPVHGAFFPTPWNHAGGPKSGCRKCASEKLSATTRVSRADFLAKARSVHGKTYDYSKADYQGAKSKIEIICKKHGSFIQEASSHLQGVGCPKCGFGKRGKTHRSMAAESFAAKARKVHGENYDYSEVKYVRAVNKVRIVCRKHGIFMQTPNGHLGGAGCPKCGGETLRAQFAHDKATFVRNARKIHGRRYSYVGEYSNNKTPIRIRCPKHGDFEQVPAGHLTGSGCPFCGVEKSIFIRSLTHNEFLKKARVVHGNKFAYPDRYKKATQKIQIRCPKHGIFRQTPNSHLGGNGCRICQAEAAAERERMSHDEFLAKAIKVHGKKFEYPEEYHAGIVPIRIVCPTHGHFKQAPHKHLSGQGCPRCIESLGERQVSRALERMGVRFTPQHKFPDCRDRRPLRFDFWLPDYKILIEFDGPQHFTPRDYYGGVPVFEGTMRRDLIKTLYARKKRLRLIRIKYSDKQIEQTLRRELHLVLPGSGR